MGSRYKRADPNGRACGFASFHGVVVRRHRRHGREGEQLKHFCFILSFRVEDVVLPAIGVPRMQNGSGEREFSLPTRTQ